MSNITCLECTVNDNSVDLVTGVFYQYISFGWEEELLPTGEILFRVYCIDAQYAKKIIKILQDRLPCIPIKKTSIPNQDWMSAWKEFFTPIHVGRFTVIPPWLVNNTAIREHSIIIEPKSAFGTGHHETTALCLEAISSLVDKEYVKPCMNFFDIGTGSAILSIACAKLGLIGIGLDIDPVAIINAEENILLNGVANYVSIKEGIIDNVQGKIFELIVANILAEPLKNLSHKIIGCLAHGGHLVLSGILNEQAEAVECMYASLGEPYHYTSGEWVALVW